MAGKDDHLYSLLRFYGNVSMAVRVFIMADAHVGFQGLI